MVKHFFEAAQAAAHTGMVLPGELPAAWSMMPLLVVDISNNSLNCAQPCHLFFWTLPRP